MYACGGREAVADLPKILLAVQKQDGGGDDAADDNGRKCPAMPTWQNQNVGLVFLRLAGGSSYTGFTGRAGRHLALGREKKVWLDDHMERGGDDGAAYCAIEVCREGFFGGADALEMGERRNV